MQEWIKTKQAVKDIFKAMSFVDILKENPLIEIKESFPISL
jgi:hypothetical protein